MFFLSENVFPKYKFWQLAPSLNFRLSKNVLLVDKCSSKIHILAIGSFTKFEIVEKCSCCQKMFFQNTDFGWKFRLRKNLGAKNEMFSTHNLLRRKCAVVCQKIFYLLPFPNFFNFFLSRDASGLNVNRTLGICWEYCFCTWAVGGGCLCFMSLRGLLIVSVCLRPYPLDENSHKPLERKHQELWVNWKYYYSHVSTVVHVWQKLIIPSVVAFR